MKLSDKFGDLLRDRTKKAAEFFASVKERVVRVTIRVEE